MGESADGPRVRLNHYDCNANSTQPERPVDGAGDTPEGASHSFPFNLAKAQFHLSGDSGALRRLNDSA